MSKHTMAEFDLELEESFEYKEGIPKFRKLSLFLSIGLLCKLSRDIFNDNKFIRSSTGDDKITNQAKALNSGSIRKPRGSFDSSIVDLSVKQRELQNDDYFAYFYYFYYFGPFNKDYDENQKFFEEDIELPVSFSEFNSDILGGYDTCDDLQYDLEQALTFTANKIINTNMHLECGYYDDYYYYCREAAYADAEDVDSISVDGFETYKQHEDVDEADVVKSDGTFVYVSYGDEIIVFDINGNELSRVRVAESSDYSIVGLLLGVSHLIVILSDNSVTEIVYISVDLSGREITITGRDVIKGSYKAARMIDSKAHIITSSKINTSTLRQMLDRTHNELYFTFNDEAYAYDAKAKAVAAIPSTAENILRDVLLLSKEDVVPQGACKNFPKIASYADLSTRSDGFINGFVRITSFETSSGLRGTDGTMNQVAAFVPSNTINVYVNKEMIFVSGGDLDEDKTYVTSFLISGVTVTPLATGVIPGIAINQFAFDYYKNYLRVATTTSDFGYSTSQVIVAEISDNKIKIVGRLDDLGVNEEIYAVRFLGDRAFVVTFRLIDPFYTIDLSVPENPTLKGELKIPGFSNHLHPIGDDHIITVGQDADDSGNTLGLQVTLFDVTDLTNPMQVDKYVIEGYSSSAAQYDHYAFRYLQETSKLVLPVSILPGENSVANDGFYIFDIRTEFNEGLNEKCIDLDVQISHFDSIKPGTNCFGNAYLQPRSLVFGENIITLKGHSMQGHSMLTKSQLFHASFDANKNIIPCQDWFLQF